MITYAVNISKSQSVIGCYFCMSFKITFKRFSQHILFDSKTFALHGKNNLIFDFRKGEIVAHKKIGLSPEIIFV